LISEPRAEAATVAVLFVAAAVLGYAWVGRFVQHGGHPFFYQTYFEPAVMVVCGKGFVVSRHQPAPLTAFLSERRDGFQCSELPEGLEVGTDGLVQRPWRYFLTTVALTWAVLGISWSGLAPLFGLFYAATSVGVYALCRQAAGRVASVAAAAAFSLSPLQLANLPNLRDYAKAPFIVGLGALLVALVVRPLRPRTVVLLALGYGLVMGVGYGFRTDLLIACPPLVAVLCVFLPGRFTTGWLVKGSALAAFGVGFGLAAAPIITSVVSKGGCQWHFSLLGLTTPFDAALGVDGGSYSWGHLYKDEYLWATISSYGARLRPDLGYIEYCSHEYDVASGEYVRHILGMFSADILTRAYAATLQILDLPFRHVTTLPYLGTFVAVIVVGALAAVNWRLASFAAFAILYFGGQTAIQFLPRHYFPFECLTWVMLAVLTERIVRGDVLLPSKAIRSRIAFAAIVAAMLVMPLLGLRWYQNRQVVDLLNQYANAPRAAASIDAAGGGVYRLVHPIEHQGSTESDAVAALGRTAGRFLEVDVEAGGCRTDTSITFAYDPTFPVTDLTSTVTLRRAANGRGATRIFEPVYVGFTGFALSDPSPSCAAHAFFVEGLDTLALRLPAQLSPDWQSQPQHQQIRRLR
jgi:hypothetical protein